MLSVTSRTRSVNHYTYIMSISIIIQMNASSIVDDLLLFNIHPYLMTTTKYRQTSIVQVIVVHVQHRFHCVPHLNPEANSVTTAA